MENIAVREAFPNLKGTDGVLCSVCGRADFIANTGDWVAEVTPDAYADETGRIVGPDNIPEGRGRSLVPASIVVKCATCAAGE